MITESSLLRPVVFPELKAREEHPSLSLENSIKYRKIDLKIGAELSSQDLCGLRLACKEWKQIAQATDLGKRLFSKKSSFFSPLSSKIYEQLLLSFDNLTPDELRKILESNVFLSKASIEKAEKAYMLALKFIIKDKDSAQEAAQQSISTHESFCIEKLGDIYVAKGTPKTLLQAAGLYNYVMSLSPIENRELLKEKLAKIHNLLSAVSEEKPLNYNLLKNQFEGNRQKLKDFRSKIEKHILSLPETPDHQVVRELFGEITQQIKAFFEILVKQSVDALGAEPCEYAMIGFGSLAREEVTPYSDLEFGILIKEDSPINREYFKRLTSLIHLKVINLGETILPALNIPCLKAIDFFDSITPRGFAFDGEGVKGKGCKTPFGNGTTFELIQTPEKMAQYISKDEKDQWWHEKESHLPMELLNFTHLLGNNELTEQYRQKVQEKLNIPYREDINLRQHLAKYHLVQEDMIAFNPGMGDLGRQGMLFKVKNDFYRFPHLALDRLALLKEIVASDTFGRIDHLNKLGVITEGAAEKLKDWMSIVLFMRLKTYSYYQAQQETMNPLIKSFGFDEPELIKKQFAVDHEALEKVKKIYRIFIPFYQAIQEFLAGDDKRLAFSDLEDNSFKTQGDISLRLFQLGEAKRWYIKALQENRESIKALEALASISKIQGNLEQAAYYANQGIEIILNQRDRKHSNLANFYNLLGIIYKDQGNLEEAAKFINQSIKLDSCFVGKNSPSLAVLYLHLAQIYKEQGCLERALITFNQALNIGIKLFGKHHTIVARIYNSIGMFYKDQGKLEQAAKYVNRALKINIQLYSKVHPYVANLYNDLWMVYKGQGNLEEAADRLNQALKINFKLYGNNHPFVAVVYNNLGEIYKDQGNLEKAAESLNQSIQIDREVFGKNRPTLATDYNNLGGLYMAKGNLKQADKYVKKAFKINSKIYEKNHTTMAPIYNNLGQLYQAQGKLKQAANYTHQALEIDLKLYGENHPKVAAYYCNLGKIYLEQEKLEEAAKYAKQATAIDVSLYGDNHFALAADYNNLGQIYHKQGDLDQAGNFAKKSLKINIKLYGENSYQAAINYNNLGTIYLSKEELGYAAKYIEKALAINLKLFGENHPETAKCFSNLGQIYKARGDLGKAIEHIEKALRIDIRLYGENHPEVAIDCNNLSKIYQEQGNLAKAAKLMHQVLQIDIQHYSENHSIVAKDYNNLGLIYQEQGDLEKAVDYIKKALRSSIAANGIHHPDVVAINSNLQNLHSLFQKPVVKTNRFLKRQGKSTGRKTSS